MQTDDTEMNKTYNLGIHLKTQSKMEKWHLVVIKGVGYVESQRS